jgi:TonB family protein
MFRSAIVAALTAMSVVAVPCARGDLQRDLRKTYTGKILSLRIPSNFDVLRFDANGLPGRPSNGEPWTTCGLFRVKKISANLGQVVIDGDREAVILSPDPVKKLLLVELDRPVHVTIDLAGSVRTISDLNPFLARIFLPGDLLARMSAAWRSEVDLNRDLADISEATPDGRIGVLAHNRPVYVVNALPTPPMAIYKPSPSFSEKARFKKVQGTFRVRMVVNEKGFPEILEVLQHLREGLDNRALAAVSQWRFKPALRESLPVASMLIVDVNFHVE